MADTLIDVTNRVLRATGQRSDKTAFSETDSTSFVRDRINDALQEIYHQGPPPTQADGLLTLPPSTRSVAISGLDTGQIYENGWRINRASGDIPLQVVEESFLISHFPAFETEEADFPQYVYLANGIVSFYPLLIAGSPSLTIQYKYPSQFVRLENAADVFPFVDGSEEMRYIHIRAQHEYEMHKLMGNPDATREKAEVLMATLAGKYARIRNMSFVGARRYGA